MSLYYEYVKANLEKRWFQLDEMIPNSPSTRYLADPFRFGITIWDIDKEFKKRLRLLKSQSSAIYDDNKKWSTWYSTTGGENSFGIPFQFIENIPVWNKSANWGGAGDINGRFEEQQVYNNSGSMGSSLILTYLATSSKDSAFEIPGRRYSKKENEWTMSSIERYTNQLKSITFPQYDGKFSPPVKCLLNIGNMYVDFPIVITNISVEETGPFEIITMRSMMKKINIEFKSSYPSWQAITATQVWTADNGGVFAKQDLQII